MKIARKVFQHPSGHYIEKDVEIEEGWWRKTTKVVKQREWVENSFSEVIEEVKTFVDILGPDRLINICEYTSARHRIGDDMNNWFVVWYWTDEADIKLQETNGTQPV
jgi:hypothetical protein